jgi:hypothetical protein
MFQMWQDGPLRQRLFTVRCERGQGSQASINQPRPTAPARVYAITSENVLAEDNATDVVTCMIPLFGRVAYALFGPGASHLFISSSYVKLCRVSTEPLE